VPDTNHTLQPAIEYGATGITNDRRYARFPNVLWRSLIERG
jgi:predicted nucleic acid-binding protein